MSGFFQPHGLHIDGVIHLSPREALGLLSSGALIVDVREEMEMNGKSFAVGTVISIPFSRFASDCSMLPKDKPLILADSVGLHSKQGVLILKSQGYTELANLNGGIIDWERDGLPTTVTADFAKGSSGAPIFNHLGNVVGMVASTRSVYYDDDNGRQKNLQMVMKNCVPARCILDLIAFRPGLRRPVARQPVPR